jgi:hypothetical protein
MNWEPIVWHVRDLPDLSTEMRQPGASRSMAMEIRPSEDFWHRAMESQVPGDSGASPPTKRRYRGAPEMGVFKAGCGNYFPVT